MEAFHLVPPPDDDQQLGAVRALLDHAVLAARIACEIAAATPGGIDYARVQKDLAVSLRELGSAIDPGMDADTSGDVSSDDDDESSGQDGHIVLGVSRAPLVNALTQPLSDALHQPMYTRLHDQLHVTLSSELVQPVSAALLPSLPALLTPMLVPLLQDNLLQCLVPDLQQRLAPWLLEQVTSRSPQSTSTPTTAKTQPTGSVLDPLSLPSGFHTATTVAPRSRYSRGSRDTLTSGAALTRSESGSARKHARFE